MLDLAERRHDVQVDAELQRLAPFLVDGERIGEEAREEGEGELWAKVGDGVRG